MAAQHLTLIEYIPLSDRSSRELELQEALVRAHVARVNHTRRHKFASKRSCSHRNKLRQWSDEADLVERNLLLEEASLTYDQHLCINKQLGSVKKIKIPSIICIRTPVKDIAVSFTLRNLIQGSYFDYVPQLCSCTSAQGTLALTLECVALVIFARHTRQADLLLEARYLHQKVLRRIRVALDDLEIVCKDETLAAVLLVAYFGLFDGSSLHEIAAARDKHLQGAISILKMRSLMGISSEIGDRMALQTWDSVALQSHCKRKRVQMDISILLQRLCLTASGSKKWTPESGKVVHQYSKRVANLRAAVHEKPLTDPASVIEDALDLLTDGHEIYPEMQDIWPYTICTTESVQDGAYRGVYHLYPNGGSAWMLNGLYRISTIWLRNIVIGFARRLLEEDRHCLSSDSFTTINELICESKADIERIAFDICACVPQHLHLGLAKNKYQQMWMRRAYKQSQFQTCPQPSGFSSPVKEWLSFSRSESMQHISSACSVIWPLYVAGSYTTSKLLRNYTIDRLKYVGHTRNLPIATVAAMRLASGDFGNKDGLDMAYTI